MPAAPLPTTGGAGDPPGWRLETRAVVAGRVTAPGAPLNVPPVLASTYRDGGTLQYGRWGNPTWEAFEDAIGAMEGGRAVAFSSGQAAAAAILDALPPGGVVVHPTGAYTGVRQLLRALAEGGRIRLRPVDVTDTDAVLAALPGTDLVWLESPTNPLLGIAEGPRLVEACARLGIPTVADNTFATPLLQRPLEWGATAVVHSATKHIGGHSDLLLGVVVTPGDAGREALVAHRTLHGAIPGTLETFLALRGLRTLAVRFVRQQQSAADLAGRLARHGAVTRVRYPGLPTDEFHDRAVTQMDGFGAIVSFEVANAQVADAVVGALSLIVPTTSLGGVETTIERRARWAGEEAPEGLLRMSVGLEHPEDLWDDLSAALERHASG